MERVKTIFAELGIEDDLIDNVLSEEGDMELDSVLSKIKENAFRDVFSQKKGELEKQFGDKHVQGFQLKVAKDLNKKFGLGYTNSQLQEFSYDDFLNVVNDKVNDKLKNATTEEKQGLIEQVNTYKMQIAELEDSYTSKYQKLLEEKENEVRTFKVNSILNSRFQKIAWDDVEKSDMYIDFMTRQILSNYQVLEDGTVQALDGTVATHPYKKNRSISNVDELISAFVEEKGMQRKNNAGGGGAGGGSSAGAGADQGFRAGAGGAKEYTGNAAKLLSSINLNK
jgi:hypothetical protein